MSGTNLSYAAPEQLLDKSFEGRADQYSLAATAYHLLSGAPPFAHPSPAVIIGQHLNSPPPRLADTRPQLADMDGPLSRALAKDPGARFKRCQDFAAALGADTPTRQERTPTLTPSAPFPGPPPPQPPAPYPRPWTPPPGWGPPPRRAGRVWALGAVAVFVVAATIAAVAIGITHSMRPAAPSASPTSSVPAGPPVASSADTGQVGIVTDDPTCTAWMPISQIWLATALIERWDLIHPGQPNPLMVAGNAWTPDQRSVMQATGNATRLAATKTVPLARMTPHRVVRELYEQFVIYGRAFADSIANNYQPMQNALGATTESVLNALISVCHTVNSGAAARRATLADAIDAPAHPAPPQDLTDPKRFVVTSDLTLCGEVTSVSRKYTENPTVKDWVAGDHHLPASAWSPQQKGLSDAVAPLMLNVADDIWRTVQRGSNPVIQDFGALGAQYQRAFAKALPTYTVDDEEINGVAVYARYVLRDACAAVGS
jgi:serine/threonine protein kinase